MVFLGRNESVQGFLWFVYMCITVGDPVIKRGGLGSSHQMGRVGIQLSKGEGWDPVIKQGGLGSNYQKGRVGIPLTGLTLQHFCACPKSEPGFPMSYAVFFYVQ